MTGRSKGQEEKEEGEEVRRVEKKVMNAVLTASAMEPTTSGVVVGVAEEMGNVGSGSGGVVALEPSQHVNQSCDCSQVAHELQE